MRARCLVSALWVTLAAAGCAVRATRPSPEPVAPGVAVAFDLGDRAARCRVEVERIPAATFALGLATIARDERLAGAVRSVAVELERGRPLLAIRLDPPEEAPASDAGRARFCALARDTAARLDRDALDVARGTVAPLRWPTGLDPGRVRFRSVQRVSRGGETLGFAEYTLGERPDGARVLLSRGAFLQRHEGGFSASDALQLEDADARGTLRSGRYARYAGGALQYGVDLRRTGAATYAYSGEARGGPVSGTFEAPGGVATMLQRIDLFSERGGGPPAAPVLVETYDPQADPVRPTPVVHRRDPSRRRGIVTQVGGRSATGVVARDGTLEWIEAAGEPPTRTETIFRDGAP